MAKTISTTYGAGFTLSGATNPLSVTSTGVIDRTAATGGHAAIYGAGGASTNWTITNSGHLNGTATGLFGINLGYFGPTITSATIINSSGGVVAGQRYGIITDGPTTITNQSGGTLTANGTDIVFLQTRGTVFNYGLAINSDATGLYLESGGVVVNGPTGIISLNTTVSGVGVRLGGVGTVTNAGTIIGGTGGAVEFDATTAANRLIVDPGAVFTRGIYGGTGVLELALGDGSIGSLGSFDASGITNFQSLVFDTGAKWNVVGNTSAGGLGTLAIAGFGANDTIDLTGFAAVTETFASNALTLTNAAGTHATLHIQGSFTSNDFHISSYASGSGTTIVDCFAAGTRIATAPGEKRIEDLAIGDVVTAHFGGPTAIQWIGRRRVDCARHPDPPAAWPVRVAANSFGPGCPRRDLLLSPNHAVYVLDWLIPIRCLINGTSIAQRPVDEITYYHLELPEHDLLLSEGLLTESYLDANDRANFSGGAEPMRLFPNFAALTADSAKLWETKACAPLLIHGPLLETARVWVDRLAESACRGHRAPPQAKLARPNR